MGKSSAAALRLQQIAPAADVEAGGAHLACAPCVSRVGRAFSFRCSVVLLLSAAVVLSALFSLPLFLDRRSGYFSDDADVISADIKASFILQRPLSLLVSNIGRLEYDILVEIGIPNTKVSIVSMNPLPSTNSTCVIFAILPDPKNATISLTALSVLRSSLVELILQQLNLTLTPSIFGQPSTVDVLKFPGGITMIPLQSESIWDITQILFNFTLNNSIVQIQKDLDELKNQLKYGLDLKPYENVYVQITNVNGSSVAPPVIVQASVLSDFGTLSLEPDRLKQLAQVITGSHAENLGLSHSIFGKVKGVVLSSYLQHSIASPSPSPSPSVEIPYSAPSPSYPTLPSYAPVPTPVPQPPCLHCHAFAPSNAPENDPKPPSPSISSPGPSMQNLAPAPGPGPGPSISTSLPPSSTNFAPVFQPFPPSHVNYAPSPSIPLKHSPLAPENYGSSPLQSKGSPDISPSSIAHGAFYYANKWLIGLLLGCVILHLLL